MHSLNAVGFHARNSTTNGESVTVTITLPSAVPVGTQYYKYHDNTWVDVTSLLGSNDGDNVLTLTLTDGELGDDDGIVNGTIVDDGGPGVPPVGGEVYPVNRVAILAPWLGLVVLISIALAVVVIMKRRRLA